MGKDTRMNRGWAWCFKCESLFFVDTEWLSYCPAGGAHDETFAESFMYGVNTENKGEAGWRRCERCQTLFLDYGTLLLTLVGPCPAPGTAFLGKVHSADNSVHYFVEKNDNSDAAMQQGWRFCNKCRGLFFNGNSTKGKCSGGGAHDATGGANYCLYVY